MRLSALAWCIVLLLASSSAAEKGESAVASSAYQAWVVGSTTKIFRDSPVARAFRGGARVYAARDEHRALQVVVTAGARGLSQVRVAVSPLRDGEGREISAISLYRVAYVRLAKYERDYPDPLPPYTPFEVAPRESQPVWVDICVPSEAAPGRYTGEIVVAPQGQPPTAIPLTLRVHDFEVPRAPTMRTAFGISDGFVYQQDEVKAGTPEAQALLERYYWFLVDHRISPYHIPVEVTSPEAARFLDDPRVTAFIVPYTDDEKELKSRYDYVRAHGWMPKAYSYVVDEPVNQEQYARLKEVADRVHRLAPDMKLVSPYFRDPDFEGKGDVYEGLSGIVDIWCPNTGFFNAEKIAAKRDAGGEIWWYVCCGPGAPYANFFVDLPGICHRALFWQQYLMQVHGLLYWSTTYWNPSITTDPWADIATVKDISPTIYGDGSLMYPGKQVGVDGPVSSIRLELIREGAQDYEYLRLLEARKGRQAALAILESVVQDLTHYTRSPIRLEAARRKLAQTILD